jgi:hypothetical protein
MPLPSAPNQTFLFILATRMRLSNVWVDSVSITHKNDGLLHGLLLMWWEWWTRRCKGGLVALFRASLDALFLDLLALPLAEFGGLLAPPLAAFGGLLAPPLALFQAIGAWRLRRRGRL